MPDADPRVQFGKAADAYVSSAWHNQPEALQELAARIGHCDGAALDIGTGAGHMAFALSTIAEEVVALDVTQEMLAIVEREAASRGLDCIRTILAPAENLPFPDRAFGGVACRVAAHHFDSIPHFLHESCRVLKPGGWLLILDTIAPEDPNTAREVNEIEALRDPSHRRDWMASEWIQLTGMLFDIQWMEIQPKRLDLEDWMERMQTDLEARPTLRTLIRESEGQLRRYLRPDESGFCLHEMSLFARKPG